MPLNKSINVPNFLTLFRIIFSFFLPIIFVTFLPYNILYINILISLFFILLSLTDFLDGYIARRYKLETKFGKAIDPIADKFLVCNCLIALLAINKIYFFWVIILICRELFMMGIRQIALENNFSINVSYLAKLKTTFQLLMISLIILNPNQNNIGFDLMNLSEKISIFITLFFSILSAIKYFVLFQKKFIQI